MKNLPTKNSTTNNQRTMICLFLILSFAPNNLQSQDYRFIDAYMGDFGKNEMFVKKSLMDYSITIVESQLDSRSKVTSGRIIEKLANINSVLRTSDKGFEDNTSLRDGFIKMNEKTIECLQNGSLILNDYDYQSSLSFGEICENLTRKESNVISYYQEIKNYDQIKRAFGMRYNITFKESIGKNVFEYNAYQNVLFYKINVMDQKLTATIKAKDKKGFTECMRTIETLHQEAIAKTNQYKDLFKDNSMNNANIKYSNFIYEQKEKLTDMFNDFVTEYTALQLLKKYNKPQTPEFIVAYNKQVKSYNDKKNLFYIVFDNIQSNKKVLYTNWFITNSTFLKNNAQFEDIHEKYMLSDKVVEN
jgi:hypothetical protein